MAPNEPFCHLLAPSFPLRGQTRPNDISHMSSTNGGRQERKNGTPPHEEHDWRLATNEPAQGRREGVTRWEQTRNVLPCAFISVGTRPARTGQRPSKQLHLYQAATEPVARTERRSMLSGTHGMVSDQRGATQGIPWNRAPGVDLFHRLERERKPPHASEWVVGDCHPNSVEGVWSVQAVHQHLPQGQREAPRPLPRRVRLAVQQPEQPPHLPGRAVPDHEHRPSGIPEAGSLPAKPHIGGIAHRAPAPGSSATAQVGALTARIRYGRSWI